MSRSAPADQANRANRGEGIAIACLCLAAGARVFVFAAAFPFFSNIDEERHFDLVVRYSTGNIPRAYEPFVQEALGTIVFYGSPEFNLRLLTLGLICLGVTISEISVNRVAFQSDHNCFHFVPPPMARP